MNRFRLPVSRRRYDEMKAAFEAASRIADNEATHRCELEDELARLRDFKRARIVAAGQARRY